MLLLCACSSNGKDIVTPSATIAPQSSESVPEETAAAPTDTPSPVQSTAPLQTKAPEGAPKPSAKPTPAPSADVAKNTCTIEIRCDTAVGKSDKAPASGVILGKTTVSFDDGASVYTVLKAACDSKGISLGGGSSYISSIAGLAERDCGGGSGWMYKVNGSFPSVGCGSYKIADGDTIVWLYTCEMGADL